MNKLVCVEDFEREAHKRLPKNALDYFKTGADDEVSLKDNKTAFKRWVIRPRVLRDVSIRDLSTKVLGKKVGFPIGISPTGMQKLAHEDGELATSKAAASMDTIYILSTVSTTSIEDIAKANPNSRKWFQLYVYKNRNLSIDLIRRAEANGFEALVFTVDAPSTGMHRNDVRNKFHLPKHLKLANFTLGTDESDCLGEAKQGGSALAERDSFMDHSLTWKYVTWLTTITTMPVIVKGILTPEDANLAILHGASAIFVSNHGGRQLDTVAATIDVLEEIAKEVNGRCDVYLDGGVSTGSDVFKALALGAKMVFVGRPFLWGLTIAGEQGVRRILEILKEELDLTMALTGVENVNKIGRSYITRKSFL